MDETRPLTEDASPEKAGMRVEARVFLAIASAMFLWFVIYWVVTYEPAGMTLLILTAGMMAMLGGFVLFQARRKADPAETGPPPEREHYLPHASVWPFAVGIGAVLVGNGIALGAWAVLPGLLLLAYGVWGYARQSRRRD